MIPVLYLVVASFIRYIAAAAAVVCGITYDDATVAVFGFVAFVAFIALLLLMSCVHFWTVPFAVAAAVAALDSYTDSALYSMDLRMLLCTVLLSLLLMLT